MKVFEMDWKEAARKAKEVFGATSGITDGLQMKDTLKPAVGVGLIEGGQLCIQGKGTTWEEAFAQAETRREKWEHRVKPIQEPKAARMFVGVKTKRKRVDLNMDGEKFYMDEDFIKQLKEKVREKWGTNLDAAIDEALPVPDNSEDDTPQ